MAALSGAAVAEFRLGDVYVGEARGVQKYDLAGNPQIPRKDE
jgi:hypothetical protein